MSATPRVGAVIAAVLLGGASGLTMGLWGPRPLKAPDLRVPLAELFRAHGEKLMEQGRYGDAIALLTTSASYCSSDPELLRELAVAKRKSPAGGGPAVSTGLARPTAKRLAQLLNQDAKNLVREGNWVEAKATFEAVLDVMPDYGSGTVQLYIDRANKEIPVQRHLEAAEKALSASPTKLGVAKEELQACSSGTLQQERCFNLQRLLAAEAEAKVRDAQALLDAQGDRARMGQLKEMAEDLLALNPEHREGLELKKTADDAIVRIVAQRSARLSKQARGGMSRGQD